MATKARSRVPAPLTLVLLARLAANAGQDFGETATNAPPALVTEVKLEEGPGLIPARRAYLAAGNQKYAFVVPARFRVEVQDREKLVLVTPDLSATLTFRLAGPMRSGLQSLRHDQCRDLFFQNYPGAKIGEELSVNAGSQPGPAFDAQWSPNSLPVRQARVAFFPSQSGILELSLVCHQEQFKTLQYDFSFVLLTFRASDANGHLDVPILSNKL